METITVILISSLADNLQGLSEHWIVQMFPVSGELLKKEVKIFLLWLLSDSVVE